MVVGIQILIGVSMVAIIAYAWRWATEMTKLVSWEELSLRTWEIMYAPSGVDSTVGDELRLSGVTTVSDARYDIAISMPFVSVWYRYP